MTTVAGGAPAASAAEVNSPWSAVPLSNGDLLIVSRQQKHRLFGWTRRAILLRVAGTGRAGFSGDGGPASECPTQEPQSAVQDTAGQHLTSLTD